MAYDYKVNSYEVYKSDQPLPQISADVSVFLDGTMLAHKTVVLDADIVDKSFTDKDSIATVEAAFVELVKIDPVLTAENLDQIDAETKAREAAWAAAQIVVDKLYSKIGGKIGLITEAIK